MEHQPNMGGTPNPGAPSHEAKPMSDMPHFDKKDIDDNKVIAALSYLGILVLIPLLAKKDSKYTQEHAKQGLVLLIAEIIGSVIAMVPIIGWLLAPFIGILFLIVALVALIKCLMGEFWEIPVLGAYRKQINL
ncbi:MAG: DUF4870 domain-containing protein [Patescibacteria group bacterium]|nr:DUF4870 domain-containing protein [Candidatus Uhrbacteria bacterium]